MIKTSLRKYLLLTIAIVSMLSPVTVYGHYAGSSEHAHHGEDMATSNTLTDLGCAKVCRQRVQSENPAVTIRQNKHKKEIRPLPLSDYTVASEEPLIEAATYDSLVLDTGEIYKFACAFLY